MRILLIRNIYYHIRPSHHKLSMMIFRMFVCVCVFRFRFDDDDDDDDDDD